MQLPKKASEVERAKLELERVNDHIIQLKTEIRVLEARRGEIKEGIEAENKALKLKRQQELAEMERQFEKTLEPLVKQRSALQRTISELERQAHTGESELEGLKNELVAVRAQLGQVAKEATEARTEKENYETTSSNISAQIATLRSQVQPLKDDLGHLQDEVNGYNARREEAQWQLTQVQAELNATKVKLERDVAKLQEKRREVAANLAIESKQIENARSAMAEWEERLKKYDKTLRAREYKVAIDEEKIAQNAGLLNL